MKNYIKTFLIVLFSIVFFYNFSFADIVPIDMKSLEASISETEISKSEIKKITIDGNSLEYEIGFYNSISDSNQIFDIKLNFKESFQWKLNIYEPINYNSDKIKLYKSLEINWKENVFQFKSKNNLSFFVENKLGNEKELKWIVSKYSDSIQLLDSINKCDNSLICTDKLDYSILSLLSYNAIIVNKKITKSEQKILLEYIYKWWQIVISESKFSEYFQDFIINELWIKEKWWIYYYWLGAIQIESTLKWEIYDDKFYPTYIGNNFLEDNSLLNILIDEEIKWKYLDYWIILIFVCMYFIIIIPINFLIQKKKWNKLFFIYSIPVISLIFVFLLIIMNIVVKWVSDIENKLEVNIIKDGKVYQQIYTLDFSPNGGDYQILLEQEDITSSSLSNYYNYYNNDKEWNIEKNKLSINFENIKSSQIIGFQYGKIKEYNEEDFDINYDTTYNKWSDFYEKYLLDEDQEDSYYRWNYNSIWTSESESVFYQMKKIWVNKQIDEEYSNKYSLGWKKWYKLRVDIYY